jgi:hypothetical protein
MQNTPRNKMVVSFLVVTLFVETYLAVYFVIKFLL